MVRVEFPPEQRRAARYIEGEIWIWNPPGEVFAPILMYHHISSSEQDERYKVSPTKFKEQMARLHAWGYTPIPISLLARGILDGAYLPVRPVVITFDDGYADVIQHAFPIMQRFGYRGVLYVISGQVGQKGYANLDELKAITGAGWEIGSHTANHVNLRRLASGIEAEVLDSRTTLETQIGVPVVSFSFPFGLNNSYVTRWVMDAGYQSAVGVGGLMYHTSRTQYYLSRIEVEGDFDIDEFSDLLPWNGMIRPWEIREFIEQ